MGDRTALYRLYDADDQLLYVGITNYPPKLGVERLRPPTVDKLTPEGPAASEETTT